jgi:DNA-binding transcriptional ArsR family regulator
MADRLTLQRRPVPATTKRRRAATGRGPNALAPVFEALASRPRREIVARLARGPMTTPQIGRHFRFSKQALNRHVGVLEHAGLIERTLHGRVHDVRLVPAPLDGVVDWVETIRRGWESNFDRLGILLGRQGE